MTEKDNPIAMSVPWRAPFLKRRRADLALAAIVGLVYLALAIKVTSYSTSGDEPRYLLMAYSIVHDHDINLANNVSNEDYRAFYYSHLGYELMRPFGKPNTAYALHYVGLPLVLAPGFALAGRLGATMTLVLAATLTTLGMLWWARRFVPAGVSPAIAVLLLSLSLPLLFYSNQVYPESIAAAIVILGVLRIAAPPAKAEGSKRATVWSVATGMTVAFLPWLHAKFMVLTFVIYAMAAVLWLRTPAGRRQLLALIAPVVPSLIVAGLLYQHWYNNPWPTGPRSGVEVYASYTFDGMLGLLFDREYGLFVRSPIYLAAFSAMAVLAFVKPSRLTLGTAVIFGSMWAVSATNHDWWGGDSVSPRYLVPVLPPMAGPLAYAIDRTRQSWSRAGMLTLAILSVGIAATVARFPGMDLARAIGNRENAVFVHYQSLGLWKRFVPGLDLNDVLPSFVKMPIVTGLAQFGPGQTGVVGDDPYLPGRKVRLATAGRDQPGFLIEGEARSILRGEVEASVRLRAEQPADGGPVGRIEVWSNTPEGRVLQETEDLQARHFAGSEYVEVPIRYHSKSGRYWTELWLYWYGNSNLAVDQVTWIPK